MIGNGDEKAVIFSQWERMTQLVARAFDAAGIGYEYLCGNVPVQRRAEMESRFNDGSSRVFLSTDASAAALCLQRASVIINLDLPWNPAVLEQRIGRVYRHDGQRNVQIISLVAAGTIEERMLGALKLKLDLFTGIMDGGSDSITLDDSTLTRLADGLCQILEADVTEADTDDTEEDSVSVPEAAETASEALDETSAAELFRSGTEFFGKLADTLRSPRATQNLLDTIVHVCPETGRKEVRIPVSDDFLSIVKNFLNRL